MTHLHALPTSARDPTLSPLSTFAIMSKTPFSADYIHKLLKTIPEAERSKFLEMLETQPILEQQPASGSSGAPALDPPPQQADPTPQTLDEFCDTVAQEAYAQPASASPAAPPPQKPTPAPAPPNNPTVTAAKPAGPAASKAPVPQKQPPAKPSGSPAADPAPAGPPKSHNKAPPPPLNPDDATTGPASQPPTQGATSEPERAPTLAADAPASRVGSVINDGAGNPSLCLGQLWACRKKCGSCENAFCQATFPDRSNSFHTLHRCRDCKRAEGRNRASPLPLPPRKVGIIPTGSGILSGTPTIGHPLGALKMAGKKAGTTVGISDQPRFGSAVKIHVE